MLSTCDQKHKPGLEHCKAMYRKGSEKKRERTNSSKRVWREEWEGLKISIIREVALIGLRGAKHLM